MAGADCPRRVDWFEVGKLWGGVVMAVGIG